MSKISPLEDASFQRLMSTSKCPARNKYGELKPCPGGLPTTRSVISITPANMSMSTFRMFMSTPKNERSKVSRPSCTDLLTSARVPHSVKYTMPQTKVDTPTIATGTDEWIKRWAEATTASEAASKSTSWVARRRGPSLSTVGPDKAVLLVSPAPTERCSEEPEASAPADAAATAAAGATAATAGVAEAEEGRAAEGSGAEVRARCCKRLRVTCSPLQLSKSKGPLAI
mmetsp:Transcript_107096/g.341792  ORF Transcript_107096/g.341792 Transcript_107096/m.341792 type:complete len:228 (-) Transcript_107096:156-839(-)